MTQKSQGLSNLQLSSEYLYIQPGKDYGEIVLTNTHINLSILFKIKTKIQKIFEVKPTKGLIQPGQIIKISFKSMNNLVEQQRIKYENQLQFLLQAANRASGEITKQAQQDFWKDVKIKKADISLGYCSVKIGVKMSGKPQKKVFIPLFSTFQSKIDKNFTSNIKSSQPSSQDQPFGTSNQQLISRINTKNTNVDDATLSKKYEELKDQQQSLQRQRMQLLSINGCGNADKKVKPKFNLIFMIIIFIVFMLLGNVVKCLVESVPQQQDKGFFSWFVNWFK